MELRAFAEEVLFTESLEVKLAAPDAPLSDANPGKAIALPDRPGRPDQLQLRRDGVRVEFPNPRQITDDRQRGVLLHFFANHELLATELMALVLLRFPEAPAAFRLGILRTLQEEQVHTRLYLERMETCGVRFGDYPLNRFFWDTIAPMETPLDYVTRLSLTFEQANLDYARNYAAILRESGDEATAAILDRIYRDEIAHVGYGLKWFRRWKGEGERDWAAYERRLVLPLSPARARGMPPFNTEGRQAAGLDPDFIREVELFSRSRGRTPNVLLFTPDAEAEMAHGFEGRGYAPRKAVASLARDLEILPAFLCRRDDVVLMAEPPGTRHREKLHRAGLSLPEFEQLEPDGSLPATSLLRERKIHRLEPWAWCPRSARILGALGEVDRRWSEEVRLLFSKVEQRRRLGLEGTICESEEAFLEVELEGPEGVVKAPYGAAAQRQRRFHGADRAAVLPWVRTMLAQQGAVVVENWRERVVDFSLQCQMEEGGLRRLGFVRLENDASGQFRASLAGGKITQGWPPELARFWMQTVAEREWPELSALENWLRAADYRGPVGVDAFLYRLGDELKLRPMVEVNPRYTMGRLAWELARRVAHGRTIRFELVRNADVDALETADPVELDDRHRLRSGTVVLNEGRQVAAVLRVGRIEPVQAPNFSR